MSFILHPTSAVTGSCGHHLWKAVHSSDRSRLCIFDPAFAQQSCRSQKDFLPVSVFPEKLLHFLFSLFVCLFLSDTGFCDRFFRSAFTRVPAAAFTAHFSLSNTHRTASCSAQTAFSCFVHFQPCCRILLRRRWVFCDPGNFFRTSIILTKEKSTSAYDWFHFCLWKFSFEY